MIEEQKTRERRYGEDTPNGAWLRNHPELRSRDGYDAENLDYIWHQFKDGKLSIIEEKRNNGKQSYAQQDTHSIIAQALTFAFSHPEFHLKRMSSKQPPKIQWYGYHLVRFEHDNPEDGKIYIDSIYVSKDQYLRFLKFDSKFFQWFQFRKQLDPFDDDYPLYPEDPDKDEAFFFRRDDA